MRRLNEEYNGWKNWATWYASMVFGDIWEDVVMDIAYENNYDTYDFAEDLKSCFYEMVFEDVPDGSLAYEYATYGLEQIDFYELAETFLQDIDRD